VRRDCHWWQRRAESAEEQLAEATSQLNDLQAEIGRLEASRDAFRVEAMDWRAEAERIFALREQSLRRRCRRLVFRTARRVWWALPTPLRDTLRRHLFPGSVASSVTQRNSLRNRFRRLAFPVARSVWWTLPTPLRDALRRRLFAGSVQYGRPAPVAAPDKGRPDSAGSGRMAAPRVQDVRESVSVVIPTLEAGPLFERVLASIAEQRAIGPLELIVADSGSTDGTRELAERAGATVLDVPPGEFGHGRTRNAAAEVATGDVLLVMVQDAVLLGPHTIRDLVLELDADPAAVAVSARQLPRSDADLHGAFVVWTHDHVIRERYERALGERPEALDHLGRRSLAALDNVCAVIRRTAWEELRFADVDFAEDLELGTRAVARGWRVRLSREAAVAHSHRRDAVYQFRRSVADRLYVAPLVGDDILSRASSGDLDELFASMHVSLREAQGTLSRLKNGVSPLRHQLGSAWSLLEAEGPRLEPRDGLASIAAALPPMNGAAASERVVSILREELLALLAWPPLAQFARAHPAVGSAETEALVAKLIGAAAGRTVGDALRRHERPDVAQTLLLGV
jgi:GT2 family glycosyltransferase